MIINQLLEIDNKINGFLNSNKYLTGTIIVLLTGYLSWLITVGSEDIYKIFDSLIFKLILFSTPFVI